MLVSPISELAAATFALALTIPMSLPAATHVAAPSSTIGVDGKLAITQQIQFVEDTGSANRIVAASYLRTFSQEIPAAVCHLHQGIDVEEATELLIFSVATFDAIALALLDGNEAMGIIGGETRRKTIVELEALIAIWEPVHDAALAVLADPSDAAAAAIVYDSTDVMLEKTYHFLSEIEGEYANPVEVLQSDVMLLEVSGRMAAMTQRMAYEACRVWSGDGTDELISELEKTIQIFEASMGALSNGMPELGVKPPPTPEIAQGLDVVAADWSTIRGYLDQVLSGAAVSVEVREDLYHQLAVKLHKVEEIEGLYQAFSKRVY
jgi:hypothetical protein